MKPVLAVDITELAYSSSDKLEVMNFLNEVAETYPNAISFGSGRPSEAHFDVERWLQQISLFVEQFANKHAVSHKSVYDMLGQYGKTTGIINELIAETLVKDEDIHVSPESILVTYGAQEGMEICLSTLCRSGRDVLLVADPTYIGITGLAAIKNIEVAEVSSDAEGPDLEHLHHVIDALKARGKRAAGFYLIPDFNNPMGSSISLARRRELLDFSRKHRLLLVEDNPYGLFRYEGQRLPTLKSLDENGTVIYLGTFAKSLCPGLRIGYVVADQLVASAGSFYPLMSEFSKVKSMVSVNTGQVHQAVIGGLLIEANCSLRERVMPLVELYKSNRDCMLDALALTFRSERFDGCKVTWNRPEGGFFIVLSLPFEFGKREVQECADEYGVICLPLSFFSSQPEYACCIRLSFSYTNHARIKRGVTALGEYLLHLHSERISQ